MPLEKVAFCFVPIFTVMATITKNQLKETIRSLVRQALKEQGFGLGKLDKETALDHLDDPDFWEAEHEADMRDHFESEKDRKSKMVPGEPKLPDWLTGEDY